MWYVKPTWYRRWKYYIGELVGIMPTLTKQVALVVVQKNPLLTRASSHNTCVCSLTHIIHSYIHRKQDYHFFGKKNGDTNKGIVPIAASIAYWV